MSQQPDGWYPDPETADQSRWFEAGNWTRHVLPGVQDVPTSITTATEIPREDTPKAVEPKLKVIKSKTLNPGVGPSTWLIGLPLLLAVSTFGAANPALTAFGAGIVVGLTALYTIITARPSWARISSRGNAILPLGLAIILTAGAPALPSNIIIAPKFITALPSPEGPQRTALLAGLEEIEPRMVTEWNTKTALDLAYNVCRDDFAAQTPEQAVETIRQRLVFETSPQRLTPEQAVDVLYTVRDTFCGQPGSRTTVAESEFVFGIPAIIAIISSGIAGQQPAAP